MYTAKNYVFCDNLADAYSLVAKTRTNSIVAGNTWLRMGKQPIQTLLDLSACGLDSIEIADDFIRVGAMATQRTIETHPLLQTYANGVLPACVSSIVGVQFRNMATIGANVYMRHGFSDILPVLLAINAELEFAGAGRMPVQTFLEHPVKQDILAYIYLPNTKPLHAKFVSLRNSATDFSVINTCVACTGGTWRITIGARPSVATLATQASALLTAGAPLHEVTSTAISEVTFGDNLRGKAAYRKLVAPTLIEEAIAFVKKEGETWSSL